jgi:CRP/FNR family cyclic AMP-dependent transcriptional regulator
MTESPDLKRLNRLESLSDDDLARVVRAGRHLHLPADWSLISEKTPADKAYLLVDGTVSVRRGGEEIATLGPGDVIGEMAIVSRKLRSASVVSTSPLEVIHFTSEDLAALIAEVPAFGDAIRATTADRSDDSSADRPGEDG